MLRALLQNPNITGHVKVTAAINNVEKEEEAIKNARSITIAGINIDIQDLNLDIGLQIENVDVRFFFFKLLKYFQLLI